MKNSILVTGLIMLGTICGFGQLKAKSATVIAAKPSAEFIREKFDPARNPHDDLNAAIGKASKENKRIILDVGGEWCGWCKYMDRFIFDHPELTNLRDDNYVWIKVNFS